MILTVDRTTLDEALSDPTNTFLLLFGQNNSLAIKIHTHASDLDAVEDWNKVFLIENIDLLNAVDKTAWYKDDNSYTTLSKPNREGIRKVVEQLGLDNLCTNGEGDAFKIGKAYKRADVVRANTI